MGLYDLIGGRAEGFLDENEQRRQQQEALSQAVFNAPSITLQSQDPAAQAAEAMMLERSGYIRDPRGASPDGQVSYINPRTLSGQATMGMINDEQERLRQETQAKLNNPLFKVADTLADTGRAFLSPLFWLKGEDMTKYDPSASLRSGYRTRMSQLDTLRIKAYDNFYNARQLRLDSLNALQKQRYEQSMPQDTVSKELLGQAQRMGTEIYSGFLNGDQDAINAVQRELLVNKGQATPLKGNRIVMDNVLTPVRQLAKDFKAKQQQTYGQALEGYDRLIAALNSPGGLGDVAAIFGFMKMLDPNSVVRESEYATAANAGGIYNRMMNMLKEVKGDVLPDTVRAQMRELAADLVGVYGKAYSEFYNDAVNSASIYEWFNPETDSEAFFGRRLSFPQSDGSPDAPIGIRNPTLNTRVPTNPAIQTLMKLDTGDD